MKSNLAFTSDLTQGQSSSDSDDQLQDTLAERLDIRSFEESKTVDDLVFGTPLSELTCAKPWVTSQDFDENSPDATFYDYWLDYKTHSDRTDEMSNLALEASLVVSPSPDQWIPIGTLFINEEGGQRLQIKDPKEAKRLRDHAWQFQHALVSIGVAECTSDFRDDSGELLPQIAGKRFVYDGGGCCMKARLRGIETLPAQVCRVSTIKELRDRFYKCNTDVNPVRGVELFKKRLVERDPFARLQDRIMERSGVTAIKHHTNPDLTYCDLGPIKKILEGTFPSEITHTSWSGDPVDLVKKPHAFPNRKAETLTFAIDSIKTRWPNDRTIRSSLCVVFAQFKAVWNGIITPANFQEFLTDLDKRLSDGKLWYPVRFKKISDDMPNSPATFTTQKEFSNSLMLTNMQTVKGWGVVALSRVWNEWAEMRGRDDLVLDTAHISQMMSNKGFRPYH